MKIHTAAILGLTLTFAGPMAVSAQDEQVEKLPSKNQVVEVVGTVVAGDDCVWIECKPGQRYRVQGAEHTLRDFVGDLARITGIVGKPVITLVNGAVELVRDMRVVAILVQDEPAKDESAQSQKRVAQLTPPSGDAIDAQKTPRSGGAIEALEEPESKTPVELLPEPRLKTLDWTQADRQKSQTQTRIDRFVSYVRSKLEELRTSFR